MKEERRKKRKKDKRIKKKTEKKMRKRKIAKNIMLNAIQISNALNKGKGNRVELKE